MGLFDLVREEQEAKKKAEESAKEDVKDTVVKEVKKVEEAPKEADQQPAPVAKAEKQATPKKKKPAGKKGEHLYPFSIYSEGRIIDISSYGFVPGKTYKEDEITKIMLQHQHYEFAGKMEYSFIKEDNVLVVSIAQHRKG